VLFALVAVPHIVFVKDLSPLELIEAVFNADGVLLICLVHLVIATVNSLALFHT